LPVLAAIDVADDPLFGVADASRAFLADQGWGPAATLTRALIDAGLHIEDDLHAEILVRALNGDPERRDLLRTLVGVVSKSGGALIPPPGLAAPPNPEPIGDLVADVRAAEKESDVLALFVACWRLLIHHPDARLAWGVYASVLVDRRDWANANLALAKAFDDCPGDDAATPVLLRVLNIMMEQTALKFDGWRHWFDALPETATATPHGVGVLIEKGVRVQPDVAARAVASAASGPEKAKAMLLAAMAAYQRVDYEAAERLIRESYKADFVTALRETVTSYGSQITSVLGSRGSHVRFGDWLGENSRDLAGTLLIPSSGSREALDLAARQRNAALERGLPSPILVTQAKSGSVSVSNILASGFSLPTLVYSLLPLIVIGRWLDEYMRGGALYVTHLNPAKPSIEVFAQHKASPIIVHARDPRQILVSTYEHYRKYPAQANSGLRAAMKESEKKGMEVVMDTFYADIVSWTRRWLEASSRLPITFMTFEEFVTDKPRYVDRLLAAYGGDTRYFDKAAALGEQATIDYHRRLGSIDEWRTRVPKHLVARMNEAMPPEFWSEFGWKE